MRSGIMAATVPISRVRIIAGATSYSRTIVRSNGRRDRLRARLRLHQTAGGPTQERKPLPVAGTQIGHQSAGGFHELRLRRYVVETHDVAEFVQDRRPLVSRFGPSRTVGILDVQHDPTADELPRIIRSR